MKKTTLGLVAASALLTTTAFSQITVSGYNETSIFSGDTKGTTNAAVVTNQIGNETVIRVAGTGKLTNGMSASFYGLLDSDETAASNGSFGERGFDINLTPDVSFQYGFDRVMGSEVARTLTPFATTRIADTTGTTATMDLPDVTSGEHAVGINVINLLGAGSQISVAYAPNTDAASTASSDRLTTATSSQSGYGAAIKVVPFAGLTVGAGYTKATSGSLLNEDLTAKTLGFTYAKAPFAIGAQAIRAEGQRAAPALLTAPSEDDINIFSGTYAISKELTLGLAHSTLDRRRTTKSADDAKVTTLSLAYNLGPAVISFDREQAENGANAVATNNVQGNDTNLNKLKVRVAF
jgi:hypothetical protein